MPKKKTPESVRARQLLAQEAARIIVDQGIRDYRIAKTKAAAKLGLGDRRSLPGNAEIEFAVSEHLQLFGREAHSDLLRELRETAISAMQMLAAHSPRLVGPVLHGTADDHSPVNLHVFADSAEVIAGELAERGLRYQPFERRLKPKRNRKSVPETYAAFRFEHREFDVEATVFPVDGIRQAPLSPIDGRPMQRADIKAVTALIEGD